MKIEKINDNQIKCTLNKSDLASRQIKLSELAYGTEKAKSLFRDMMQQAANEFGFEADDIPLMIEAIPVSGDCIVLIITKVDDPEELDTRFSKFAPSMEEIDLDDELEDDSLLPSPTDILDMFNHVKNEIKSAIEKGEDSFIPLSQTAKKISQNKKEEKPVKEKRISIKKIFSFNDLDTIIDASKMVQNIYNGSNSLYKSPADSIYYLVVNKSSVSVENFNKTCNVLAEYGNAVKGQDASEAFYKEHYIKVIAKKALQKLQAVD